MASSEKAGVTSFRIYLEVEADQNVEAIGESLSDALLELGFNAGPRLNAAIVCVSKTEDVEAFADNFDRFFGLVKDDAAFILLPAQAESK
jgi:hypothetical protein